MDYLNLNYNICRICLDQNVIFNWNEEINDIDNVSYKHCYYKYTQLEMLVEDPYTQMLCQSCVNDLETTHVLITKALASYANLQQTYSNVNQTTDCDQSTSNKNEAYEAKYVPNEFEILILQNNEEPIIKNEIDEKESNILQSSVVQEEIINKKELKKRKPLKISIKKTLKNSGKTHKRRVKIQSKKLSQNKNDEPHDIPLSKEGSINRKTSQKKLCSVCSLLCSSKRALKVHEECHKQRERSEVCPYCSIKFFNKACLKIHLKTHNKDRKKYNCEFCDKSYFDRGTLNVHRRVHLGKMIPCSICSKEFYRQSELDRHNTVAHSAAPINADAKERSRYYVLCKYCNKQMLTTSYKAHMANHEQDPLMKCSLCNKDFFTRTTCRYHMKKVHNYKAREEYEQFIIYHKTNRLSHLLLKQHEIIAT